MRHEGQGLCAEWSGEQGIHTEEEGFYKLLPCMHACWKAHVKQLMSR